MEMNYIARIPLLNRQYIEPIQLAGTSLELAYTGVINKANLFEVLHSGGRQ